MKRYAYTIVLLALCLAFAWYHGASAASLIEETSVLNGNVSWTVPVGTQVKQGSSLINIATLTGDASASRASADGTVQAVLVKPGDTVKEGEVVVKLQPLH